MSTHWRYEIWVPASRVLTKGELHRILAYPASYGYTELGISRHLSTPSSHWVDSAPASLEEAVDLLMEDGGFVYPGKIVPIDWHLGFELIIPAEVVNAAKASSIVGRQMHRSYNEILLFVEGDYRIAPDELPEERQDRFDIATAVQGFYGGVCSDLDVPYGAAWRNHDYEALMVDLHRALYGQYEPGVDTGTFQPLMDGERLDQEVRSGQPPGVLFWLQYFSHTYSRQIPLDVCQALGGTIHELPRGVLVSFFDYPWEVNRTELLTLNRRWRHLHPESLAL